MRILVFLSDNRHLSTTLEKANYNSLSACINYEYCKHHGYDFIYYRPYLSDKDTSNLLNCRDPTTKELRHASWSKLLSTRLALQLDYDYVVYIDSDCIFKDFNQSLEEFIKPYSDKDIITLNNKPWSHTLPCAGFYISKVNNTMKELFIDWYKAHIPELNTKHIWEQEALNRIHMNYNIAIVDSWMFEEKEHQFLRHVCHVESYNRMPYFSLFIKSKHIDYEANIRDIKVINFDTESL
jgi:hypothetical protein